MTTTRWRDITHKPTCRDASRYEFLEAVSDKEMTTMTTQTRCINYPCALPAGHDGRCSSTDPQMTTQTDEQVVRQKYPFASVTHCSHIWEIWRNEKHEGNYYDGRLGYSGDSQSKAWADARSKLPTDPQNREQSPESSKPSLSPEIVCAMRRLSNEAKFTATSEFPRLIAAIKTVDELLDALEGKSYE